MPPDRPEARLTAKQNADVLAFLLNANNVPAGATPLTGDKDVLLKHRLTALLPPPLPGASVFTPVRRPVPLQNCDGCDRAFRATEPGHCRDCRIDLREAA